MIAGIGCIPRRRAQSRNDQQLAAIGEQRPYDRTTFEPRYFS